MMLAPPLHSSSSFLPSAPVSRTKSLPPKVVHTGAKLKGHYSRLDFDKFQHNHANTQVIKRLEFNLPVGASDAYYRDIIGNISTRYLPFLSTGSL